MEPLISQLGRPTVACSTAYHPGSLHDDHPSTSAYPGFPTLLLPAFLMAAIPRACRAADLPSARTYEQAGWYTVVDLRCWIGIRPVCMGGLCMLTRFGSECRSSLSRLNFLRRVACVAVVSIAALSLASLAPTPAKAIVNGSVVPGGFFSDATPSPNTLGFVGLLILKNGSGCTASLVAPDLALTAGHCEGGGTITFGILNRDRDRGVTRAIAEEKYQSDANATLGLGSTLLVRLDQPIYNIAPVRLAGPADRTMWAHHHQLINLGWGQINDTSKGTGIWSRELRVASMRVEDDAVLASSIAGTHENVQCGRAPYPWR